MPLAQSIDTRLDRCSEALKRWSFGPLVILETTLGVCFAALWLYLFFGRTPAGFHAPMASETWATIRLLLWYAAVLGGLMLLAPVWRRMRFGAGMIFWNRNSGWLLGLLALAALLAPAPAVLSLAKLFQRWPEHQNHVLWLLFTGFLIPVGVAYGAPCFEYVRDWLAEIQLIRRWFIQGRGGSARWAGPSILRRRGMRFDHDPEQGVTGDGLFLGRSLFGETAYSAGQKVGLKDNAHVITIGCPGSGKSMTALWPALALWPGPAIVLDPKGEHARETFWRRTDKSEAQDAGNTRYHLRGGTAYKLDPFNQEPSIPGCCYDPLSEIDIDGDRARELLSAISDGCVLPEGDKNRHFVENARTIIEGVIAHVLTDETPEKRTLAYVHDLLIGLDPEFNMANPLKLEEFVNQMRQNPAAGGLCFQAATLLDQDTRGEIMSTVQRSIKWMGDPSMRQHLAGHSAFRFADLPVTGEKVRLGDRMGHRPTTIYVTMPIGPLMEAQARWLRVLTNVGLTIMRQQPKGKVPTLFILDEFAQMGGQLKSIETGYVTLREKNVKLWIFLQDDSQPEQLFGKVWSSFLGASNLQLFGITSPHAQRWVSEQILGSRLSQRREQGRVVHETTVSLWSPDEVKENLGKNINLQVVSTIDGRPPLKLERVARQPVVIEGDRFRGLDLEGHFSGG